MKRRQTEKNPEIDQAHFKEVAKYFGVKIALMRKTVNSRWSELKFLGSLHVFYTLRKTIQVELH